MPDVSVEETESNEEELTDQEVLDRPYVEFEIKGKTYRWESLPRRNQRRFRDRMYATSAKCGELVQGKTKEEISNAPLPLFVITDILEILEDFNAEISEDMDSIDAYVDPTRPESTKEIARAFGLLFAKWVAPNMTLTDEEGNVTDGSGKSSPQNRATRRAKAKKTKSPRSTK